MVPCTRQAGYHAKLSGIIATQCARGEQARPALKTPTTASTAQQTAWRRREGVGNCWVDAWKHRHTMLVSAQTRLPPPHETKQSTNQPPKANSHPLVDPSKGVRERCSATSRPLCTNILASLTANSGNLSCGGDEDAAGPAALSAVDPCDTGGGGGDSSDCMPCLDPAAPAAPERSNGSVPSSRGSKKACLAEGRESRRGNGVR